MTLLKGKILSINLTAEFKALHLPIGLLFVCRDFFDHLGNLSDGRKKLQVFSKTKNVTSLNLRCCTLTLKPQQCAYASV